MKWRTTTPTEADGLILCEVDYGVLDKWETLIYLARVVDGVLESADTGEDAGWKPNFVNRWVPYTEIQEAMQ